MPPVTRYIECMRYQRSARHRMAAEPRSPCRRPTDGNYGRTLTSTTKAIFAPVPTTTMFCPDKK